MKELAEILGAWAQLRRAANPAAILATVVRVEGSAYRRPGARMLLTADGRRIGVIGGPCLERHVAEVAWALTRERPIAVTRYDTTSDADLLFGSGAGCRGVIQVMLERLGSGEGAERMALRAACRGERRPGVIATLIARSLGVETEVGEHLMVSPDGTVTSAIGDPQCAREVLGVAMSSLPVSEPRVAELRLASGTAEVFLEVVLPPPSLLVFGAGPDAAPLVRVAKELGWHVTVLDARAALLDRERFSLADALIQIAPGEALASVPVAPGTAAVVMSHDFLQDLAVLEALRTQPLDYLGILGPRGRTARLLQEGSPEARPASAESSPHLHAPAGLDIGAESPEEIALAIVAEIQATLRGRPGGRLRDRPGGIHGARAQSRASSALREMVPG